MPDESCTWTETEECWETECDESFLLTDGTPESNGMVYCCFCGKPIVQVALEEDEEDKDVSDSIGG